MTCKPSRENDEDYAMKQIHFSGTIIITNVLTELRGSITWRYSNWHGVYFHINTLTQAQQEQVNTIYKTGDRLLPQTLTHSRTHTPTHGKLIGLFQRHFLATQSVPRWFAFPLPVLPRHAELCWAKLHPRWTFSGVGGGGKSVPTPPPNRLRWCLATAAKPVKIPFSPSTKPVLWFRLMSVQETTEKGTFESLCVFSSQCLSLNLWCLEFSFSPESLFVLSEIYFISQFHHVRFQPCQRSCFVTAGEHQTFPGFAVS